LLISCLGSLNLLDQFGHADRKSSIQEIEPHSLLSVPKLLNEITEFWFEHRTQDAIPNWSRFSPQSQTKFLPYIVLWEVVKNSYSARVTGETVVQMFPVKIANQRLHDVLTDDLSSLPDELDRAIQNAAPIYVDRPNAWILNDETVHCQAVHLPFCTREAAADRILSVMAFETEPIIDI